MFSKHRHVRVERVVLEHHGDVAVARLELVDDAPADGISPGDRLQPRDHAQQGGLAAARRADDDDELAVAMAMLDAVTAVTP
jgi:hypothetical protein